MSEAGETINPVENELSVPPPAAAEPTQKDEGVMIGGVSPDPIPPSPPRMFESVPRFSAPSPRNPRFSFSTLGGRPIALTFYGSAASRGAQALVKQLQNAADMTRSNGPIFCGVSSDPRDETERGITERPTFIIFWDTDQRLAEAYGVAGYNQDSPHRTFKPQTFVIDPRLRLFRVIPMTGDPETHVRQIMNAAEACTLPNYEGQQSGWAPVLEVPRVFEPEFCRRLIQYYEDLGGTPSGFMRQQDGKTVGILDPKFKRRRDANITDQSLIQGARTRISRRLVPEIWRAYQFKVTRIERDIVACYDGEEGGYFNAHRDNTTTGTAHRRFACTINLNAEEYDGGHLRFPEFGNAIYKPPTGGACIFSCSMLHQALPVTRGTRYCYLPFLYDDAAAKVRSANFGTIDGRQRDASGQVIDDAKKSAAE
ncbi:MAG: 2OG-Fe(II) oxygenase [Pseudomonadota bacterium]